MNGETYPLDDAAIELLAELREQIRAANIASNAVIALFAKQHGLTGRIRIADNGRELILEAKPPRPRTHSGTHPLTENTCDDPQCWCNGNLIHAANAAEG